MTIEVIILNLQPLDLLSDVLCIALWHLVYSIEQSDPDLHYLFRLDLHYLLRLLNSLIQICTICSGLSAKIFLVQVNQVTTLFWCPLPLGYIHQFFSYTGYMVFFSHSISFNELEDLLKSRSDNNSVIIFSSSP